MNNEMNERKKNENENFRTKRSNNNLVGFLSIAWNHTCIVYGKIKMLNSFDSQNIHV